MNTTIVNLIVVQFDRLSIFFQHMLNKYNATGILSNSTRLEYFFNRSYLFCPIFCYSDFFSASSVDKYNQNQTHYPVSSMSSVRWSQLNDDSDQVSDASSEDHHHPHNNQKLKQPEPTSLKKIISSPPQILKNTVREEKINEELQKLNSHIGDKVWLYVLDSSKNDPKVVIDILNHNDEIEKVITMNKGWNIFLRKQRAQTFIENGLKQRGVDVKMIFSNKNNEGEKTEYKKPQKFEKLPKRQYASPNSRMRDTKSPKYKQKRTYSEKADDQKNLLSEQSAKKKVKYVARDSKSAKSPDNIQKQSEKNIKINNTIPEEHHEDISSESPQISTKKLSNHNHNPRIQHLRQPVHLFNGKQSGNEKNQEKQQQKDEQKEIQKEREQPQEKVEKKVVKDESESDSSEELEKQRKMLEKKKGKKKKKGGKVNGYQDSNNPFAVFGN